MRAIGLLVVVVTLAPPAIAFADSTNTPSPGCSQQPIKIVGFEDRPWFQPLPASPRESQMQLLGFGLSRPSEYMTRPGLHKIWDITLGKELPLDQTVAAQEAVMAAGALGKIVLVP